LVLGGGLYRNRLKARAQNRCQNRCRRRPPITPLHHPARELNCELNMELNGLERAFSVFPTFGFLSPQDRLGWRWPAELGTFGAALHGS
jgi:hypothetical protein